MLKREGDGHMSCEGCTHNPLKPCPYPRGSSVSSAPSYCFDDSESKTPLPSSPSDTPTHDDPDSPRRYSPPSPGRRAEDGRILVSLDDENKPYPQGSSAPSYCLWGEESETPLPSSPSDTPTYSFHDHYHFYSPSYSPSSPTYGCPYSPRYSPEPPTYSCHSPGYSPYDSYSPRYSPEPPTYSCDYNSYSPRYSWSSPGRWEPDPSSRTEDGRIPARLDDEK